MYQALPLDRPPSWLERCGMEVGSTRKASRRASVRSVSSGMASMPIALEPANTWVPAVSPSRLRRSLAAPPSSASGAAAAAPSALSAPPAPPPATAALGRASGTVSTTSAYSSAAAAAIARALAAISSASLAMPAVVCFGSTSPSRSSLNTSHSVYMNLKMCARTTLVVYGGNSSTSSMYSRSRRSRDTNSPVTGSMLSQKSAGFSSTASDDMTPSQPV
mmetsp:Transcript_11207/g.38995  ORF Transcript_11207/g.38995 Transcript_11207/m.38995 type:complete len:219 (-) Transcript_11207:817-1473(-)